MSYSRRQLEALGEPLGESVTRKEGGRIIYGGGGSAPSQQTQTVVNELPDWAKPSAQKVLARGEALTEREYVPYRGERIAGFQPLQQQAFGSAAELGPSGAGQFGMGLAGAAGMRALGARFNPYQTGQFQGDTAASYMSPFIQQALEPQMREARRASEMQRNVDQAQAVQRGAFGGSRQAIVEAERQRNLGTQLGDIQARGLQSAFDRAQQQFNTEQQLREQSRQFGGSLGMQGLQTALQGAGQLGALGQQQFGQQKEAIGLQSQLGGQQQALEQQRMSQQYQDFLNQQRYPYQQLEFMSNLLRGTPMGTVQTMYTPGPTMAQNIGALGLGAYGVGQLMRAEGGTVSSYAEGGSVTDEQNVDDILDKLSDAQLHQARDMAMSRQDVTQVAQIDKELAQRASLRSGLGSAFNTIPEERQEQMMANGGIVAFQSRGVVDSETEDDDTDQVIQQDLRMPVGRGDLPTYGAALTGLTNLYTRFKDDKGFTPLTAEEERTMYDRSVTRGKEIYGDVLSKIKANIESERGLGEENLRQQRGLAALSAAEAMLQGRGAIRGLAQAGGAFGRSYSKALEADAAQKRALTNMELNLAKAEADQRMGLHEKAEARVAKANADRRAAHTAGVNKTKAEADILHKMGRISMPPAPTKTGTGAPKLSPDERVTLKAEAIALGKDKFMGQSGPDAASAYLESIGKSAAARMGSRYTGPDKSFDRQVKLQQLYANDPQLKAYAESLAMAQLSGNQQRIKTLQEAITARETALAKNLPEVPGATPRPAPAGQPAPAARITPEEFSKQWAALKPGQTLVGPDGVTYTKQQPR